MKDGHGRVIDYARISITDRCNLRCVYCMPPEGVEKVGHADILSYEDILRVCRALAGLGVRKIKVTGGEPLVRRGAATLVGNIKKLPGIDCVTLTTNGMLLEEFARPLRDAGLDGINVSLDTLDADLYRTLTRRGEVGRVLHGIDAAYELGFPLKVNCVPVGGLGGQDVTRVALLARERNIHVRFIEMMPIGLGARFAPVRNADIRRLLEDAFGRLEPCGEALGNGPAAYHRLDGFKGRIGFIDPLSGCICERCNRLRLTADGALKTCLHMDRGRSLRSALADPRDDLLLRAIRGAVADKPAGHSFSRGAAAGAETEQRIMAHIGG